MQSDVPQRADGHRGAGRIDGHAAPVGMRDGDHAVHVGKARQNLRPDALRGIFHGGRDALHRGGETQDVLGAGTAIGVAVALECVAVQGRQRGRDGGRQRERVERRRRRACRAFPRAPNCRPGWSGWRGRWSARNAAPVHPAARSCSAILCDCGIRSRAISPSGNSVAGRRTFRVHQNGDVVAGVDANVQLNRRG